MHEHRMANMHRMHFMFYMHYMHVLYPHMHYVHGGIYKRGKEKENGESCYVRIQKLNTNKNPNYLIGDGFCLSNLK